MDFFEHQEKAKNRTGILIFFFGVAVALIVLAVYSTVAIGFRLSPAIPAEQWESLVIMRYWDPQLFAWISAGTLLLILSGSLYKIKVLSDRGGEGVSEMFDGSYVNSHTRNSSERRLINIVEEMAIASGISVPRVYLMEGQGINAFAAGFAVNNAVIGVTQGCLDKLTRQELQGVVAHEFSHIINGDMKSNLRLIGILHGILLLNIIGYTLVRAAGRGGGRSDGRVRAVFFLFGLALMIIGYLGVFFGRLIKAGVSRQREFLADATAVQYTRDPEGIYGALEKISLDKEGGRIDNPASEEVSHLFFGNAMKKSVFGQLFSAFSTHPPLEKRMQRILPNGKLGRKRGDRSSDTENSSEKDGEGANLADMAGNGERVEHLSVSPAEPKEGLSPSTFSENFVGRFSGGGGTSLHIDSPKAGFLATSDVGSLSKERVDKIGLWMTKIPTAIAESLSDPRDSASLLLSVLLSRMPVTGGVAEQGLLDNIPKEIWNKAQDLMPLVESLKTEEILPVVELAIASIRDLPKRDLRAIHNRTFSFDGLRGEETLFDYMISSFIRARISEIVFPQTYTDPRSGDALRYVGSIRVTLSTLARTGHPESDSDAEKSYQAGVATLAKEYISAKAHTSFRRLDEAGMSPASECDIKDFDGALFSMRDASPMLKKSFLDACYNCISQDKVLRPDEIEMFRAIAGVLDCPMPPLLVRGG